MDVVACRDAVVLQHQLELASPTVCLSVVDNLLIAHYSSLSRSSVFDPSIGVRKALGPAELLRLEPSSAAEVCMALRAYQSGI